MYVNIWKNFFVIHQIKMLKLISLCRFLIEDILFARRWIVAAMLYPVYLFLLCVIPDPNLQENSGKHSIRIIVLTG